MECPKNLFELTKHYFQDRSASLCSKEYRAEKAVKKGCPQGSCCGPGYWNVLYNSLLNQEFSQRSEVIAFADDLLIMTKGKSITETENYTNQDIKVIEKWAKNNKIRFNESKSKVLLVTNKKNVRNEKIEIYLNNKPLEQVEELKYLGIYIDKKLKSDKHVDHIETKAISLIHALSKSAKLTWGLGHKALHTIYTGAIEPILTYGAPVWGKAIENHKNRTKLQRIQRLINIKLTKAYRTISYDASCIIAGIQPIDITIDEKVKLYETIHGEREYDAPLEPENWAHPTEVVHIQDWRRLESALLQCTQMVVKQTTR